MHTSNHVLRNLALFQFIHSSAHSEMSTVLGDQTRIMSKIRDATQFDSNLFERIAYEAQIGIRRRKNNL